jgi:hypothetical protein
MRKLTVDVCDGRYSVCRFDADAPLPAELFAAPGLVSATRTEGELSIICRTDHVPEGAKADDGWRRLTVRGPLEFTLTGIMAALSGELAAAGVPLFALSTFDTDHLLIKEADLDRAVQALTEAGHEVLPQS